MNSAEIGRRLAGLISSSTSRLDRDGNLPAPATIHEYHARRDVIAASPLIDGLRELLPQERLIAAVQLDPARDPFLRDHRLNGTAILPLVVGMEMFAEAARVFDPQGIPRVLHTVRIVNGLKFHLDRPQRVTIHLTRSGDDLVCELRADFCDREGRLTDPSLLSPSQFNDDRPPRLLVELDPTQWNRCAIKLGEGCRAAAFISAPVPLLLREIAITPRHAGDESCRLTQALGLRRLREWGSRMVIRLYSRRNLDACYHAAPVRTCFRSRNGSGSAVAGTNPARSSSPETHRPCPLLN